MEELLVNPIFMAIATSAIYFVMQAIKRFNLLGDAPTNRVQRVATGVVAGVAVVGYGFYTGDLQADFSIGVAKGLWNLGLSIGSLWGVVTLTYHGLKDWWERNE